jgi:hypothetical protein
LCQKSSIGAVESHNVFFIFYFLFFHRSIRRPKRLDGMPTHALLPTRFRYIIPSNAATDFGLIVV